MSHSRNAFTLLELAIVLVVISLIIGGIAVGRSMTDNAKVMSLITEQEKFTAAIKQFKDKYQALPGDMYNATSYWAAWTTCPRGDATTPTTCNGNGNGKIASSKDKTDITATGDMYEAHRAWQQLALAGLISGTYNGGMETGGTINVTPGTRVPPTQYSNASGWNLYYIGPQNGGAIFYNGDYGHVLYLGTGAYDATAASKAVVLAQHQFIMDSKVDDGLPATGKIRSGQNASIFSANCVNGTIYNTAEVYCVPLFITGIK